MTEAGAQRKIKQQYGEVVPLSKIGVGDFNPGRQQWPVYVSGGSIAPAIYWIT